MKGRNGNSGIRLLDMIRDDGDDDEDRQEKREGDPGAFGDRTVMAPMVWAKDEEGAHDTVTVAGAYALRQGCRYSQGIANRNPGKPLPSKTSDRGGSKRWKNALRGDPIPFPSL